MTQPLRLICVDLSAPPLFDKADPDGTRRGYEPSAAETIAAKLGRPVEWVVTSWGDMIPAVNDGRGDAIWCGQGITDERAALVDFTDPYAVFDESLLVRADTEITTAADLAGRRVAQSPAVPTWRWPRRSPAWCRWLSRAPTTCSGT